MRKPVADDPFEKDRRKHVYCPGCDYAVLKEIRDMMIGDATCIRCNSHNISMFYSYGSFMHQRRYREFVGGHIIGSPVPFPEKPNE